MHLGFKKYISAVEIKNLKYTLSLYKMSLLYHTFTFYLVQYN